MSRLHICNTFFENELREKNSQKTLEEWFRSHPIFMQLQFLPLLYASSEDWVLVSDLPENPDPRLRLLSDPPSQGLIEHWGPSRAILSWAKSHHLPYSIPEWETVQTINSKIFSYTQCPKLPHSLLLQSQEEITHWIEEHSPSPLVLKTPFGTAGKGHFLNPDVKQLYSPPLIGEPWVERTLDFSSQWNQAKLLGVTCFQNEANGTYQGTYPGTIDPSFLQQHLQVGEKIVQKIAEMGYSENIGIDAFIYRFENQEKVHPVVEINARKTMSWIAFQLPQKQLFYTKTKRGLLPSSLTVKNKKIEFSRNISISV